MLDTELTTYYFAYGSNIDEDQMLSRCPYSMKVYKGFLKGHKLFASHNSKYWKGGVFSIKEQENSMVYGIIYEITPEDLENLDRYEGYPTVYDRKEMEIDVLVGKNGKKKTLNCITYISNRIEPDTIVSENYLYHCEEAADKEGISLLL